MSNPILSWRRVRRGVLNYRAFRLRLNVISVPLIFAVIFSGVTGK